MNNIIIQTKMNGLMAIHGSRKVHLFTNEMREQTLKIQITN